MLYLWVPSRKNPTTFPGIMLSEMPYGAEIILPLAMVACIMKMTAYACYEQLEVICHGS